MQWSQDQLWALAIAYHNATGKWPPGVPQPPAFDPNTDPGYVATTGAGNKQLADVLTGLGVTFEPPTLPDGTPNPNAGKPIFSGGQYLQGAQTYGFDEAGNPIAPGDTRYNPFSKLEDLKKSFENRKRGTLNSYAAAGQLYSGALENAKTTDATNYAENYDVLKRGAGGFYTGLVSNALSATDATGINTATAGGTALTNSLLQHQNDPPPILPSNNGPKAVSTTGHTVTTSVKPSTYTPPKGTVKRSIRRPKRRY